MLIQAFLAAEDAEFFEHKGVDYKGIVRAMFRNLVAGRIVQGGSTITQQVTKTFFLTPKRSLLRKLREVAYSFGLERNLTKEQILSRYLNNIYLGNGAYGIEAASESYFNKRTVVIHNRNAHPEMRSFFEQQGIDHLKGVMHLFQVRPKMPGSIFPGDCISLLPE